ncbi:hypothetical protein SVIOM74S_03735 [Streptomyces violarus]
MVAVEAGEAAGERGLATARAADHGQALAGSEREMRDAQDGVLAVVHGGQVPYLQDGLPVVAARLVLWCGPL